MTHHSPISGLEFTLTNAQRGASLVPSSARPVEVNLEITNISPPPAIGEDPWFAFHAPSDGARDPWNIALDCSRPLFVHVELAPVSAATWQIVEQNARAVYLRYLGAEPLRLPAMYGHRISLSYTTVPSLENGEADFTCSVSLAHVTDRDGHDVASELARNIRSRISPLVPLHLELDVIGSRQTLTSLEPLGSDNRPRVVYVAELGGQLREFDDFESVVGATSQGASRKRAVAPPPPHLKLDAPLPRAAQGATGVRQTALAAARGKFEEQQRPSLEDIFWQVAPDTLRQLADAKNADDEAGMARAFLSSDPAEMGAEYALGLSRLQAGDTEPLQDLSGPGADPHGIVVRNLRSLAEGLPEDERQSLFGEQTQARRDQKPLADLMHFFRYLQAHLDGEIADDSESGDPRAAEREGVPFGVPGDWGMDRLVPHAKKLEAAAEEGDRARAVELFHEIPDYNIPPKVAASRRLSKRQANRQKPPVDIDSDAYHDIIDDVFRQVIRSEAGLSPSIRDHNENERLGDPLLETLQILVDQIRERPPLGADSERDAEGLDPTGYVHDGAIGTPVHDFLTAVVEDRLGDAASAFVHIESRDMPPKFRLGHLSYRRRHDPSLDQEPFELARVLNKHVHQLQSGFRDADLAELTARAEASDRETARQRANSFLVRFGVAQRDRYAELAQRRLAEAEGAPEVPPEPAGAAPLVVLRATQFRPPPRVTAAAWLGGLMSLRRGATTYLFNSRETLERYKREHPEPAKNWQSCLCEGACHCTDEADNKGRVFTLSGHFLVDDKRQRKTLYFETEEERDKAVEVLDYRNNRKRVFSGSESGTLEALEYREHIITVPVYSDIVDAREVNSNRRRVDEAQLNWGLGLPYAKSVAFQLRRKDSEAPLYFDTPEAREAFLSDQAELRVEPTVLRLSNTTATPIHMVASQKFGRRVFEIRIDSGTAVSTLTTRGLSDEINFEVLHPRLAIERDSGTKGLWYVVYKPDFWIEEGSEVEDLLLAGSNDPSTGNLDIVVTHIRSEAGAGLTNIFLRALPALPQIAGRIFATQIEKVPVKLSGNADHGQMIFGKELSLVSNAPGRGTVRIHHNALEVTADVTTERVPLTVEANRHGASADFLGQVATRDGVTYSRDPGDLVPLGTIIMWSLTAGFPIPPGWVVCDGATFEHRETGKKVSVPDMRDRFIKGGDTLLDDLSGKTIGPTDGGSNAVTLTKDHMPKHSHDVTATTGSAGSHTHTVSLKYGNNKGTGVFDDSGLDNSSDKTIDTESAGAHTHSVSVTCGEAGKGEAFHIDPSHIKMAFLMKIGPGFRFVGGAAAALG